MRVNSAGPLSLSSGEASRGSLMPTF
jgi:hypothetical protein